MSQQLPNLRKLEYSLTVNPLVHTSDIKVKQRQVRTGVRRDLVDPQTGEVSAVATIHSIEEKDDAQFVKVFAAGLAATYDLSKTAQRTFQAILDEYQRTPMAGGFVDTGRLPVAGRIDFVADLPGIDHILERFHAAGDFG